MKSSTKNKVDGKLHETKGKSKEVLGELLDDTELENEGRAEKIAGQVQQKIAVVEKKLGN